MADVPRVKIAPTGFIYSASFETNYPRLVNGHLIEWGAKSSMEESWNRRTFGERSLPFFRIKGAYVIDECLILDRDLRVIENASDPYSDEEVRSAVERIRSAMPPHFDKPTIVAKRRAAHNYGHYLCEILPMAWTAMALVGQEAPQFLVHRVPTPMLDVVLRSLRLLGAPLDRVMVQGAGEPMFFEDLVVVRGLTEHGTYMSPLCVQTNDVMARAVVGQTCYDKLFVRRVPGWRRGRQLHNEAEIASRLADLGYSIVEPGLMTLEQQIAVFRSARHIVGVAGAGMTNILFCEPGTKVTLLFPDSFPDTFFWFIAQHRRLDYTEIRGPQTTHEGHNAWEAGFTINPSDLNGALH